MLTIDVMVLVVALYIIMFYFLSTGLEQGEGSSRSDSNAAAIIFLSIIAFLAYKLVAAAGFRFLRKARPEPPRT